jgi:outer membrane lipoprotein SlyB
MKHLRTIAAVVSLASLGACATGSEYAGNVYTADQANAAHAVDMVTILAVQPAKLQVSNAQGQQTAKVAGAILGIAAGALIGHGIQRAGGGTVGALAGGFAGSAAGSLAPATVLVDAVSVTYRTDDGRTLQSVQVGQLCQFAAGRTEVVFDGNKPKVQPNAQCPAKG